MMPNTAIRSADPATVTVSMDDDDLVVAVAGELCMLSVPLLEAALEGAFETGRRVVVDLRDVTLLSAAGVGLFAHLARQHGDRFGIVDPSGRARRTLALTQMEWLVVRTDDASIDHDAIAAPRRETRDRSLQRATAPQRCRGQITGTAGTTKGLEDNAGRWSRRCGDEIGTVPTS